jgi:hypothetical protein
MTEYHNELKEYILIAPQLKDERDQLVTKRNEQRENHIRIVDAIEQEKIVQIDNLRKEMLLQIRAVKIKMLNMNEDQLVGTTKLTVI